uniref:Uncharacterized protein MANES_13G150600 n=1 Tax=Rhizophora mucronata TaxID=61149 RepID=A0A2P2JEF3_RHIMU
MLSSHHSIEQQKATPINVNTQKTQSTCIKIKTHFYKPPKKTSRNTRQRGRGGKKRKTFIATRGAFTSDLEVTIDKNPKPTNSITIPMAGTPTRYFHIISTSLDPTNLCQLFIAKQHLSFYPIRHISLPLSLSLNYRKRNNNQNLETPTRSFSQNRLKTQFWLVGIREKTWTATKIKGD